jgi:diaminohydroxyphosphoribosylaminopyrimidine deaminase / 5-amino-6-(5-phosphoribosylamino)uracil reductase
VIAPETSAQIESCPDPMARALALAAAVRGQVSPNPAVGAVVLQRGEIVAEGWTSPPGGPHAEVVALREAGQGARGATLFVTLEPCSHHGRTPPCTDAIIAAGVSRVVCSMIDPDVHVQGSGIRILREAGIEVEVGSGEAGVKQILAGYIKHRITGLPLVTAKFAMSLDGKIGTRTGDSRWVSGPQTLAWAHEERTHIDAIAVGINTVLVDNPQLTARPRADEISPHQPLRVVADSSGRTPPTAHVLEGESRTVIATTDRSDKEWRRAIEGRGGEVLLLPARGGHVDFAALLAELGERGCLELLVEGGGILLGSLFDDRLIDRVQAVVAPMIIGGATAPVAVAGLGAERMADVLRLDGISMRRLGEDLLIEGLVRRSEEH